MPESEHYSQSAAEGRATTTNILDLTQLNIGFDTTRHSSTNPADITLEKHRIEPTLNAYTIELSAPIIRLTNKDDSTVIVKNSEKILINNILSRDCFNLREYGKILLNSQYYSDPHDTTNATFIDSRR